MSDPSIEAIELLHTDYVIPSKMTTYKYVFTALEDEALDGMEGHIVAVAPKIAEATRQYVHHITLTGYLTGSVDPTNGGCGSEASLGLYFCNDDGKLFHATHCDATCDVQQCAFTHEFPPFGCDQNNTKDFGLECDGNKLTATHCNLDIVVPNVAPATTCACTDTTWRDSSGFGDGHLLYIWAPGIQDFLFPDEAGLPLRGTNGYGAFSLNIHYNNLLGDEGQIDQGSGLVLYVTKNKRQHDAAFLTLGDTPGALYGHAVTSTSGLARHRFACGSACTQDFFPTDITVFGLNHHTHFSGARAVTRHYNSTGDLANEIRTEYADFDFQTFVDLDHLIGKPTFSVGPGDSFIVDCFYDSRNIADATGVFGLGSYDEMCDVFLYFYPAPSGSLDCHPNGCEDYCGPTFFDDVSGLDRQFGTPCGGDSGSANVSYYSGSGCHVGGGSSSSSSTGDDPSATTTDDDDDEESSSADESSSSKKGSSSIVAVAVAAGIALLSLVTAGATMVYYRRYSGKEFVPAKVFDVRLSERGPHRASEESSERESLTDVPLEITKESFCL